MSADPRLEKAARVLYNRFHGDAPLWTDDHYPSDEWQREAEEIAAEMLAAPASGEGAERLLEFADWVERDHPCAELCQRPRECLAPAGGPCLAAASLSGAGEERIKARMERAEDRLRDLAQRLGVPDGGRYLNDWYDRIDHLQALAAVPPGQQQLTPESVDALLRMHHFALEHALFDGWPELETAVEQLRALAASRKGTGRA